VPRIAALLELRDDVVGHSIAFVFVRPRRRPRTILAARRKPKALL
jgi:hypothetical protein